MTYSFISNNTSRRGPKELTPELQSIYKHIPESVSHVPHESFKLPSSERKLFGDRSQEFDIPQWTHFPEIPEDSLAARKARKALSKEDEMQLFLRFNYAR
jgi:hypothetical protein